MKIDEYGQVQISEQEAFLALYTGKISNLAHVLLDNEATVARYNHACDINADALPPAQLYTVKNIDQKIYDQDLQKNWFMPESYKNLDIESWLLAQCKTHEQQQRVKSELILYHQYQLITLLKYLKYLVDTMRSNNIVWGVGRGSSVASYCLYLIGVHKIDSLRWDLDIREFLKSGE